MFTRFAGTNKDGIHVATGMFSSCVNDVMDICTSETKEGTEKRYWLDNWYCLYSSFRADTGICFARIMYVRPSVLTCVHTVISQPSLWRLLAVPHSNITVLVYVSILIITCCLECPLKVLRSIYWHICRHKKVPSNISILSGTSAYYLNQFIPLLKSA